jgi:hydrogenase-4 membrane subunit HyfE
MDFNELLVQIVNILAFAMVVMALGIATVKTVREMIRFYQVQSLTLALVTLLTAAEPVTEFSVAFVGVLPLGVAISIEALLARATVPGPGHLERQSWREYFIYWLRVLPRQANPIWLEHRASQSNPILRLVLNLGLTVVAYVIAFSLVGGSASQVIDPESLAVSMALVLLGLFTMSSEQDIISQIMGLLVMEHGMFLAAIKVITIPSLAIIFVISLFLYLIVTLTILIYLLPELHRASGSIEVEEQEQLKG